MISIGNKRGRNDSVESNPKLQQSLGSIFGNKIFLSLFQKLYFPKKNLDECAIYILDRIKNIDSFLYCIQTGIFYLKNQCFLSNLFEMLSNTYVLYIFQKNGSIILSSIFNEQEIEVNIISATIKNGKPLFLSELFEIELVNNGSVIQYVAKLRKDIRLLSQTSGKIKFVSSNDETNPPVLLGKGSYGFVFKVLGVNGVWYIVKVFGYEESARDEWDILTLIFDKHECFQRRITHELYRIGDIEHMIVSEYQGDIVLSKIRKSVYLLNLQQFIWMFLDLAKGINKLHTLNILHCDIKPDNIIIEVKSDGTLQLVIIDFGISSKIGKITNNPNSNYTWWFRNPRLFLDKFLREYITIFVDSLTLSPFMDWWAFFISFLHVISHPSNNFFGFRSRTEEEVRRDMINTSPVAQLMIKMKRWLTGEKRNIEFVQAVYLVLLEEEGPEKFIETFKNFGINLEGVGMYEEYLCMFKKLRNENPMITYVRNVFKHVRCEDSQLDISGPMNKLIDLFIEILCDGFDLSLLDCLMIDHIQLWIDRLDACLVGLCRFNKRIFFY